MATFFVALLRALPLPKTSLGEQDISLIYPDSRTFQLLFCGISIAWFKKSFIVFTLDNVQFTAFLLPSI